MKRKFTLTLAALAASAAAFAQTPVTINSMPLPTGMLLVNRITDNSGFAAAPAAGANMSWNYSSLSPQSYFSDGYGQMTFAQYPDVNMIKANAFTELVPGYGYFHSVLMGLNNNHFASYGHDLVKQVYSMGPVTGFNNDSITIPLQTAVFSSPAVHMPFPLTSTSVWHSEYQYELDALIDITLMGMTDAPIKKRSYVMAHDSIKGWGTMVVPSQNGPSQPYNVLMAKHMETVIDSFFLNGSPAPQALLGALGQSQGQTKQRNMYRFYRQGTFSPLAEFDFGSDMFTQPTSVTYDQDTQGASAANSSLTKNSVQLYPNPSNGALFISSQNSINLTFTLTDLAGRQVYAERADFNAATAQKIQFPAQVTNGFYIYQLTDETGKSVSTGKVSLQR